MKRASFRVKRNAYGNLNGYLGNRKVQEFGLDGSKAKQWMLSVQAEELAALQSAHSIEGYECNAECENQIVPTQNVQDCMPCGPCR